MQSRLRSNCVKQEKFFSLLGSYIPLHDSHFTPMPVFTLPFDLYYVTVQVYYVVLNLQGQKRQSHGAEQQLRKCKNGRGAIAKTMSRLGEDLTFIASPIFTSDASRLLK